MRLAERRVADLLQKIDGKFASDNPSDKPLTRPTVREAVERFLKSHGAIDANRKFQGDIEYSSHRKYRTKLYLLRSFCEHEGITDRADANFDVLEGCRSTRKIGPVTWKVELQALRTFFGYCVAQNSRGSRDSRGM